MKQNLISFLFIAVVSLCAQTIVYEPIAFTTGFQPWTGAGKTEHLPKGGPAGKACRKVVTTKISAKRHEATGYKIFGRKNYQLRGEKVEYSFQVKGKGVLQLSLMNRGDRDSVFAPAEMLPLKKIELSEKWQSGKVVFNCLSQRFGCNAYITYKISGEGNYFLLAEEQLKSIPAKGEPITAFPRHLIVRPQEKAKVTFTFPQSGNITVFDGFKNTSRKVEKTLDVDISGKISANTPAPGTRIPGVGRVSVDDPATGQHADVFVNCISNEEYSQIDAAAKKIKLNKTQNILFLGDSLTDYDRDRNYTDKVSFWINKYNPGKWHFRNAGVGGDHLISLYERLKGGGRTWRKNMYKDLFAQKWDMIFIFLGHNDTRAHYRTDGKIYQPVAAEVQAKYWKDIFTFLRKKSNAKIVLITPCSPDFSQCVKAASYNKKAGRNYVIFGEAPRVEEYCAIQKKAAKEFNIDIIDIYTPLKDMKQKSHLFTKPDGVHLSSKGNNFVSLAILKYLAK